MNNVVAFLGQTPRREYYSQTNGPFQTYNDLKNWLLQREPADPLHTYKDAYGACRQKKGESFDSYHSRFTKAHSLLETLLSPEDQRLRPSRQWRTLMASIKRSRQNLKKSNSPETTMSIFGTEYETRSKKLVSIIQALRDCGTEEVIQLPKIAVVVVVVVVAFSFIVVELSSYTDT